MDTAYDPEISSEANGEDEIDDGQEPGTGPYGTLHNEGPQQSLGCRGHPDNCQPCTFYCFTRRGCNRGVDCKFCHLTHQSKLQMRREAWKKQQREKRKAIRERGSMETVSRSRMVQDLAGPSMHSSAQMISDKAMPKLPQRQVPGNVRKGSQAAQLPLSAAVDSGSLSSLVFTYTPARSTLTMGQQTEIRPALFGDVMARQFSLLAPLPRGLCLDPVSGIISGAPLVPCPTTTIIVEVDLMDGRTTQTCLELEVVDFTRGGFVIGHISEVEPGRFMLVLYVPGDNDTATSKPMTPGAAILDAVQSGPQNTAFSEPSGLACRSVPMQPGPASHFTDMGQGLLKSGPVQRQPASVGALEGTPFVAGLGFMTR